MRILRPRLFRLAAALLSLVPFAASAQVNHTTSVTLANVLVNGASVPYGRLCAVAGDSYGNPVSFSSVGWGVISAGNPFCANVVNGAVSGGLSVPDANQTNRPTPITYTFSLQLTNSSFVGQSAAITLFSSVAGVSGSTFSLDSYTPPASAVVPAASSIIGAGSGVPASCTSPSIWIVPGSTPTVLVCNAGIYQAGSTVTPSITYGTVAGTVTQGNDARIVAAFKNQGAFSSTQAYNANDVVSVGSSLYYAPTAIAASTTAPPGGAWLALGGGTVSSGGTVTINGVSCATGSTCSLTPATLGLAVAATSSSPMSGLDYWIPFSQGSAVDVTGNGHNGTISGTGTAAAYVLGGIQPNAQTVSIPNASGRPSFGFCAYFPGGQAPLNYGYFYSASAGAENGYNLSTIYGAAVNHGTNAYWPQIGLSAGSAASESLNGFSGNHCVEGIPGATGQNIVVDGKEVSYAAQASAASPAVGGAQLTAPMIVAGGNGVQTGLPITVYSVWGTPASSTDTVAQASARTAFEVSRLQSLGIPFGAGAGLNTAATDSTCAFDGTSIDQGFEAGGVPVSTLLTLSFPCTLHDFSVTGQPTTDMDAAFQDRAGSVYHPRAQKNIAWNSGFVNSLVSYSETSAQALQDLLSWNRKAHALGYKTIVALALSRGGSTNGTTNDALYQATNQLVLANADEFDWVANPAAWPQLGATGAYANTTYFNTDSGTPTHPTAAGQAFFIQTEQAAFNGVYGAAPRTITASATQLPADRTVIANCAAACTYSLMDANTGNFNSRGKLTVQNVGSATVTLVAVTGETVGVANTLAVTSGTTVTIAPYEANFTTAGAVWAIQSGLGGSVSPAPVGTLGQFPVSQGPGIGYTPVSPSGDCTASTTTLGQFTCLPNNQVASSAIAANTMVYADPANVGKYTTAALGKCGSPAAAAAASGATFRVLDPIDTWTLIADGAVTYGDFLIPSTTTAGHVQDSGTSDRTTISMEQDICGKALATIASAGNVLTEPLGRGTRGLKVDTLNGASLAGSAGQAAVSSLALAGRFDATHATLVDVFPFNEADGATSFTGIYGNTCTITPLTGSTPPAYAGHALVFGSTTVGGLLCPTLTQQLVVQMVVSSVPVVGGNTFFGDSGIVSIGSPTFSYSFGVGTTLQYGSGTSPQFLTYSNTFPGTSFSDGIPSNGIHTITTVFASGGSNSYFFIDSNELTTNNGQQSIVPVSSVPVEPLTVGYTAGLSGCTYAAGSCQAKSMTVYGFAVYSVAPTTQAAAQALVATNQSAFSAVLASHGYVLGSYVNNNTTDVVSIACGVTSIEAGVNSGTPGCDPSVTGLSSTTYYPHTVAMVSQTSAALLSNNLTDYFAYSVPTAQTRVAYIGDACTNDMAQTGNYANATPAQCYQLLLREVSLLKNPPQTLFPGAKPFDKVVVGTMISRVGLGNPANPSIPADTLHDTWNGLVRAGASLGGYVLSDEAADPRIGADGANSGTIGTINSGTCPGATTYFSVDCIHPTLAGQTVKGGVFGRVMTSLFGATASAPSTTASTSYAMSVADNFLVDTPTAAAALTLPECLGLTGQTYEIVNGSTSFNITASGFSGGETITGSTTIAPQASAHYRVQLISAAAGGCNWLRTQ